MTSLAHWALRIHIEREDYPNGHADFHVYVDDEKAGTYHRNSPCDHPWEPTEEGERLGLKVGGWEFRYGLATRLRPDGRRRFRSSSEVREAVAAVLYGTWHPEVDTTRRPA